MGRKNRKSVFSLLLALLMTTSILTGCSKDDTVSTLSSAANVTAAPMATATIMPLPENVEVAATNETQAGTADPFAVANLTDEQRNSICMLNFLTVLTQEISASTNSRLFLENAYSSLINNTYPNAVDEDTLFQLNDILDALETFRMLEVKRERLDYVYEQNKAQALRDAIPNPLGLMSAVKSFNLAGLITSVVYMAADSATSYASSSAQADLQYLQDGWDLTDEEKATLHNLRTNAFSYMVTMVNAYDLPGDLALNEEYVADFVAWENETNIVRRIQLLESNKKTYAGFGPYWLLLADSYFKNGDYTDCIAAIESYEDLSTRIFRKDYEFAQTLPVAIVAAEHVFQNAEYVTAVARYLDLMLANTANNDWALRYFAAQTYIDLYNRSGSIEYLNKAYDLVLNNVTHLVREQLSMNEEFMNDVKTMSIPKGTNDARKKEIEQYNKLLQEERKTATAPVSDALVLNCDLLFALAETLDISEVEQQKVDNILHDDGERLFLVAPLDDVYWFNNPNEQVSSDSIGISFAKDAFSIPAVCVTVDATVTVTVVNTEGEQIFADWTLTKVERKDKTDLNSFMATYTSPTMKKCELTEGDTIIIEVMPKAGGQASTLTFEYSIESKKTLGIIPGIEYVRTK